MQMTQLINEDQMDGSSFHDQFAVDVLVGLSSQPKRIPAKYFYDDRGSEIFQKITQNEDYYPTRTEYQILHSVKGLLPKDVEEDELDVIELGVGDGHKSKIIIDGFLAAGKKINYYPIDISRKAMELLESNIKYQKKLNIHGIVAEYFEGLKYARSKSNNRQLVLFLGSNIGNFDLAQSQGFLRRLWMCLNHGDLAFIGFDLKKDIQKLTAAYNDSAGLTREFNLNLLDRINSTLGGEFPREKFQHLGVYNPQLGAMESYLLATEGVKVRINDLERSFKFRAYEPIHLEYSFKFLPSDIDFLAKQTGFQIKDHFSDENKFFIDSLWQVCKENFAASRVTD